MAVIPAPPTVNPIIPVAFTKLPVNLCTQDDIRQGFATFAPRAANSGAPLISETDATTASPMTLAAESLAHSTEGWRYLSSALTALLANAEKQAVHFAYYAELRAAISILASHGLRVRQPTSTYVESNGVEARPLWLKESTHTLVWALWKEWATTNPAEDLFLGGLRVHPSVSLRAFKDAIAQVSVSTNLTTWARDLHFDNEKRARNDASYEALHARQPFTFMASEDFAFVRSLWELAEPTGVGLTFECQLVRWMLEKGADDEERSTLDSGGPPGAGERWIFNVLASIEHSTGVSNAELKTVLSLDEPSSQVFAYAFDTAVGPRNIVARAFFLLRLSMLPLTSAFSQYPATLAKQWLREWLEHCGLFDPASGIDPADIWADFSHLGEVIDPTSALPAQMINDANLALDTLKLAKPEAVIAWSVFT